eukprot:TRINITY_DN3052_c0_g1_i2.p1 TRINITY_DN3052_c0_g1~~TRINITY_DN3052_c0_g1_i2.p1  ORF type:complete len:250 (-),score=40.62 TRINITY_DN3052_c0_g1_i2:14-763(-)
MSSSHSQTLHIVITDIKGRNLPAKDAGGTSDPYISFTIENVPKKTAALDRNLNPDWKENFEFSINYRNLQDLYRKHLVIHVFDKDQLSQDDFIGMTSLDLNTLALGPPNYNLMLFDKQKSQGTISFKAQVVPFQPADTTRLLSIDIVDPILVGNHPVVRHACELHIEPEYRQSSHSHHRTCFPANRQEPYTKWIGKNRLEGTAKIQTFLSSEYLFTISPVDGFVCDPITFRVSKTPRSETHSGQILEDE